MAMNKPRIRPPAMATTVSITLRPSPSSKKGSEPMIAERSKPDMDASRDRTGKRGPAFDPAHQKRDSQRDGHIDDGRGREGLEALVGNALDLLGLSGEFVHTYGEGDGRILEDRQNL